MPLLAQHDGVNYGVSTNDAQVGAAFTVLQVSGEEAGQQPLELQAAKSRLLHTEPAAGALGLAMLAARLQGFASHQFLHLRSVNPHVAAIFQVCHYFSAATSLHVALPQQTVTPLPSCH